MAYVFPRPPKKKATAEAAEVESTSPPKKKGRAKKPIQMMGYTDSKGKPKQKSSGLRDPVAALAKAQQIEQQERDIRDGVRPAITGRGVTFGDIANRYMDSALGLLESAPQVKGRIRNHLLPLFGERLASAILPAELDEHFAKLLADGSSASSVRQVRSAMSMIYKYAIRSLRMRDLENPVKDANDIPLPKRKPTPIPLSWVEPLLANVSRHYYPLFVTALFTGQRKGELAGLRICDVDLETRMIHVTRSYQKATTKGKKDRLVGIHQGLIPLLQNHIQGRVKAGAGRQDPLFTVEDIGQRDWKRADGERIAKKEDWAIDSNSDLPDIMRSALKKAGIVDGYAYTCRRGASGKARWGCGYKATRQEQDPDAKCPDCGRIGMWIEAIPVKRSFKDLRSTFGTWVAKSKGNIRAATVLLGHSDVKVTEASYALLEAEDLLGDIDQLPFILPAARNVDTGTDGLRSASYAFLTPEASERPGSPNRAAPTSVIPNTSDVRAEGIEPTTYGLRVQGKAFNSGYTGVAGSGTEQHRTAKPGTYARRQGPPVAPGSTQQQGPSYAFLTPSRPNLTVHDGGGDRLLTPEQVANALGVCRDTVYRAIKRGELAVQRFGSAVIRVRASDLEAFLARSATSNPKGTP